MAKQTPKQKSSNNPVPVRKVRKVNVRGLAILGGAMLVLVVGLFALRYFSDERARASSIAQARELMDAGKVDKSLQILQKYTEYWPDDPVALRMESKLRAENINPSNLNDFIPAMTVTDQLLRLDPSDDEVRTRLTRLYIEHGDRARAYAEIFKENVNQEIRYSAAVALAKQLIASRPKDAEPHRLLGMAYEGLDAKGNNALLKDEKQVERPILDLAIDQYDAALRIDPGDVLSAEREALILLDRRKDRAAAERKLEALVKAKPDDTQVRLFLYRFYTQLKDQAKAIPELEAALKLSPKDTQVIETAAGDALARGDLANARRYLELTPADQKGGKRYHLLLGILELSEQHPEDTVEQWRKGLSSTNGTDEDLTFRLARLLLLMDRVTEARPVVAQFQRLIQKEDPQSLGRFLYALMEMKSGRSVEAVADFERASDKLPDTLQPELNQYLGMCYEAIGNEPRAIVAYQRASALAPTNPAPRRSLARIRMNRDPAAGLNEMKVALNASPNNTELLADVGRIELNVQLARPENLRDFRELDDILGRADKVAPNNQAIRKLRATYLVAVGKPDQAIELMERTARGPDHDRQDVWVDYVETLLRANKAEEALKILDQAALPGNAGDHAAFRIYKARIHTALGRGLTARDDLTRDIEAVPKPEQGELWQALSDILRGMGDRDGARAALASWVKAEPDRPRAGLALLMLAQTNNDDEAARLGLDALRAVGGEDEPYGLAAQIVELLRVDRQRPDAPIDPAKLDQAERLSAKLQDKAAQLPIGQFVRGMVLEQRGRTDEAITAYRMATKDTSNLSALGRLLMLLTKQKRYGEISELRRSFEQQRMALGQQNEALASFDRLATDASLRFGDKQRAEDLLADLVQSRPDDIAARAQQAELLDTLGKKEQALATLSDLVKRRPDNPTAWIALVTYQNLRGMREDAIRTIDRMAREYKGERTELVLGRCRWITKEIPAAAKLYDAAVAKAPDDMTTLKAAAEFNEANDRGAESERTLRAVLKLDPSTSWAARTLALRLSSRSSESGWAEAWALIAPGASASGDTPDDRLVRATLLARCPDKARRQEAAPMLSQLAEDLPITNMVGIEARVRLTTALLEFDRAAEAVKYIEPISNDPTRLNPLILSLAAEALARSGRVDDAAARSEKLVVLEPKSPRTINARAWVLQARKKSAEAAALVEGAIADFESVPEGEGLCVSLMELLNKLNQPDAADRAARRISARWPRESFLVGRNQLARKEYAPALESAGATIQAGAVPEGLRIVTSIAIARRDDAALMKTAGTLCDQAVEKAANSAEVLVYAGTIRHLQGRYEDEMAMYRKALECNPANLGFLNNMAWTLSEGLNQTAEALVRIDEVMRREGVTAAALDTRGVIYMRQNKLDLAIADLEKSVELDPIATTYFHLARAYSKAGKTDQQRRCRDLARSKQLDPSMLDPTDRTDLDQVMGVR